MVDSNSIKIIAHRGASAEAPENTISSVKRALEIGVEGIEIDVRLTKDDHVVLFHDKTIAKRPVESLTLKELKRLNPDIPLLSEILAIDRGSTLLFVEVKQGSRDIHHVVDKVLKDLEGAQNIIVGSFCPEVLALTKGFPRFAIAHKEAEFQAFLALDHKPDGWALHYSWADRPEGKRLLQESILYYWTVDSPSLAKKLKSRCHAIVTNKPRELKSALLKNP